MKQEKKSMNLRGIIFVLAFVFIGLIILFGSWYTVSAGQRAILLTFGKPSEITMLEGLHFKIPFIQHAIKMDIKTQKYEADVSAASADLQIVSTKIAVNYHLASDSVPEIYQKIGLDYESKIIQPAVQEVVKASTAQFTAEELITKRELIKEKIDEALKQRLTIKGIIMETTSITNFDFSSEFNQAIESKVTAEQFAFKATRDLERIKIEAEQRVAEASGKADAISIESRALRENKDILQLRFIEKWDGKMPLVVGDTNPLLSISNLRGDVK